MVIVLTPLGCTVPVSAGGKSRSFHFASLPSESFPRPYLDSSSAATLSIVGLGLPMGTCCMWFLAPFHTHSKLCLLVLMYIALLPASWCFPYSLSQLVVMGVTAFVCEGMGWLSGRIAMRGWLLAVGGPCLFPLCMAVILSPSVSGAPAM